MDESLSTACPNCKHDRHLPGTECSTPVHHGPSRMHICLCLARPGAALSCPPQMTCQGGALGYSDIWYLQHGHTLLGADGEISPEVLRVEPRGPRPDAITLDRSQLAVVLAHHADVLAAQWRTTAPGAAAPSLTSHANDLTAEVETPAIAELLDNILDFPAVRKEQRAQFREDSIPAWEAAYDSATFTPYLIGYLNDEVSAKGAALAWFRSQVETDDVLAWEPDPQMATGEWDRWFTLCRTSAETGTELATDIVVRRRAGEGS